MVGEMRDQETVEIGSKGSINRSLCIINTCIPMMRLPVHYVYWIWGRQAILVASALRVIIAQRLVSASRMFKLYDGSSTYKHQN